jgi:tetratricopeptide (TPR) repeat protein
VRLYNDAQAAYLGSRYTEAEDLLKLVLKQQKIYPDALYLFGNCRWAQKDYKGAIKWYDKALKQTPTNVELLFHKALAYEDWGKSTKAVKYYYATTDLNPNYALAWKRLGGMFMAAQGYAKANDYYTRAIEIDPLDKESFMLRGNVQAAMGNLPEAVTDYNYVLQHDADDPDAWYNLASVEYRQGHAYEAVKAYSMVIDLRPRDRDAHVNRGVTLLALALREDALRDLDSAIAIDSACGQAWWTRAYLFLEQEKYPAALENARKASTLLAKDPEAWLLLGRIEFRQRHYPQALAAYDRCIDLDKGLAEAYLNRGEAKRVLGLAASPQTQRWPLRREGPKLDRHQLRVNW